MENTKQKILNAALDLFSTQGYEATSMLQIAESVGIKKASLYSHFESKQEILGLLIKCILEKYEKNSIFSANKTTEKSFVYETGDLTVDDAIKMILSHVNYILHDPEIVKSRKMLTIEQFRNHQMADLQTKQNYTNVMNFFKRIILSFIEQGRLIDAGSEIMTAQLCLPISVWINLCDREPSRESEIMSLIEKHSEQFFNMYKA